MKTDLELQEEVITALNDDPALKPASIGVAVHQGVVTLTGEVGTNYEKKVAAYVAGKVAGVKAIAERTVVGGQETSCVTDAEIAKAIVDALYWNSAVNEHRIKIKVEDGVVTMEGETAWDFQRTQAKKTIEKMAGVKMVCNCVKLKRKATPADLQQRIKLELAKVIPHSQNILVDIVQNAVILRGTVSSPREREDAEKAVFCAKGIQSVDNKLEIAT